MIIHRYSDETVRRDIRGVRVSAEEILYLTALVLWIIQIYIGKTIFADFYGGKLLTAIRYFCMLIFALKILMSETSMRIRVMITLALLCAVFIVVQRHINTGMPLIQMVLMIYGAKDVSFRRICKVMLWTCVIMWLIPVLVDKLGIFSMPRQHELKRDREFLNFNYVSFAAIHFNNIVFCALYAYTDPDTLGRGNHLAQKREVSWIALAFLTIAELWIYLVTDTMLPLLTIFIFLFLYVAAVKLRFPILRGNRFDRAAAVAVFPVFAYLTYWMATHYNKKKTIWVRLDKFSHSRVSLAGRAIKQYGIHLFGSQIVENTDETRGTYFYVDSGYIKTLVMYGAIVFAVVLIMYMFMTYAAMIEHDQVLAIWLVTIAIYSIYNNNLLSPAENGSVLALCYCMQLYSFHKKKKRMRSALMSSQPAGTKRRDNFESAVQSAES